jgi:hypothetical protein
VKPETRSYFPGAWFGDPRVSILAAEENLPLAVYRSTQNCFALMYRLGAQLDDRLFLSIRLRECLIQKF